jgi:flagellar hook-associated protein 1
MYGINVGFEIGKRALLAQQYSLNLTGHNIANVNTPGYTRQQAILSSTNPFATADGNFGTGVDVVEVRHLRSVFLDDQFRQESQNLGRWQQLAQNWGQIETVYNEPSDTGFSSAMDKFWNSWQDLATNPDDESARVAVREQATQLVNSFNHFAGQLSDLQKSLDDDIQKRVGEINKLGHQIADLNVSIQTTELTGNAANDLRDRRDLLIDELSTYVNVQVVDQSGGSVAVQIGSMALVDRSNVSELESVVEGTGANVVHMMQFKDSKIAPKITSGELSGLLDVRDNVVASRIKEMDELAVGLATKVNELHRQGIGLNGQTGLNFFDVSTTGAASIKLDNKILEDVSNIAASSNGERGDNSNALSIAALRSNLTMSNGSATYNDFYSSIVGTVGVRSREAQDMLQNQESLVAHIDENRQALEGVSLDEETTNMIKYQHAYEAAARVISTMDEAMNTIINNMGSGR